MTQLFKPVPGTGQFIFACPLCQGKLDWVSSDGVYCAADDLTFACEDGIWHFLLPQRVAALAQFRQEYEIVRQQEGRGSDDPAFYRALPFVGEGNPQITQISQIFSSRSLRLKNDWAIRAQSFGTLVKQVILPLERVGKRPLSILDLGAGNGWLSNQLARRGHKVAAVDLGVSKWDGLGAHLYYETNFACLQAEFDHLPLEENQVDVVIFNASFHYSVDYAVTLGEARRVLREDGVIVVLDTAVYQHHASGQQMVAEREAAFNKQFGFASNALPNENFLTPTRLNQLAEQLCLSWIQFDTVPMWRQWVRRLKVRLRGQREPAQFPIVVFATGTTKEGEGVADGRLWTARKNIKDFAEPVLSLPKDLTDFPTSSFFSVPSVAKNSLWLFLARVGQQGVLLLFVALVA
ncbi:hypothetical protein MNBD_CHLOROFLEXI01-276, partial [hydrothermal vent metagenome]